MEKLKKIKLKNQTRYFLKYDNNNKCQYKIDLYEVDDTYKTDIIVSRHWFLKLDLLCGDIKENWIEGRNNVGVCNVPFILIFGQYHYNYELDEKLFNRISRGIEEIIKLKEAGKENYCSFTYECHGLIDYLEHFLNKKD